MKTRVCSLTTIMLLLDLQDAMFGMASQGGLLNRTDILTNAVLTAKLKVGAHTSFALAAVALLVYMIADANT